MNNLLNILLGAESVWAVITRGIIWIIAVLILAYGVDEGHKKERIKNEVGFFFLFLSRRGIHKRLKRIHLLDILPRHHGQIHAQFKANFELIFHVFV